MHACCVDALVALALLLLVVLAPQAIMHACCVDARAALAALALLRLLVLALLLLSLLLLSLLLRRLQCLGLSRLSRFPFHDSQVYFFEPKSIVFIVFFCTFGNQLLLQLGSWLGWAPGGLPGVILEQFWLVV